MEKLPDKLAAARFNRVMIVDDDPLFTAILEQVFRARGVKEVFIAGNGALAAQALRERPGEIEAITLDLSMPGLDGVAFLRQAHNSGFCGRLLLVSGEHKSILASAEKLAHLYGLNCSGTLAKPVDFNTVADIVLAGAAQKLRPAARQPSNIEKLNASLRASRLTAFYQPRIDASTGKICGAEALARMWDEQGSLLDAGEMIDLAEKHGRINDITWRMIEIVVEDSRRLCAELSARLPISFNISAAILENDQFPDQLGDIIRLSGMQPADYILELTESVIPRDTSAMLESLTRLRMQGFRLAIDDFGTGMSNIDQLGLYPFTELKIDKEFILAATKDGFARACVEASVSLARQLDLRVVAEGVETQLDLKFVRACGVEEVQGYLFGRPMPFADFLDHVRAETGPAIVSAAKGRLAG